MTPLSCARASPNKRRRQQATGFAGRGVIQARQKLEARLADLNRRIASSAARTEAEVFVQATALLQAAGLKSAYTLSTNSTLPRSQNPRKSPAESHPPPRLRNFDRRRPAVKYPRRLLVSERPRAEPATAGFRRPAWSSWGSTTGHQVSPKPLSRPRRTPRTDPKPALGTPLPTLSATLSTAQETPPGPTSEHPPPCKTARIHGTFVAFSHLHHPDPKTTSAPLFTSGADVRTLYKLPIHAVSRSGFSLRARAKAARDRESETERATRRERNGERAIRLYRSGPLASARAARPSNPFRISTSNVASRTRFVPVRLRIMFAPAHEPERPAKSHPAVLHTARERGDQS
jgi:hypothetical protein